MRFGVICVKRNEYCSVVSNGEYTTLKRVYNAIKEKYNENDIKLIEIEEEKFNQIKENSLEIHNTFKTYFEDVKSILSLDKTEY